ncbi:hypothetical protein BDN67DRAFT_159341 [Paxillus ammoniavirescens]|nr:hypothetical protein BDN67DRAFT_159341 [Paxillus ammoniavirescens]
MLLGKPLRATLLASVSCFELPSGKELVANRGFSVWSGSSIIPLDSQDALNITSNLHYPHNWVTRSPCISSLLLDPLKGTFIRYRCLHR